MAILTAGKDPHYALGLLGGLVSKALAIDFVANDEMMTSPHAAAPNVTYWNLRRDQAAGVPLWKKGFRILRYYAALVRFAASTRCSVFHVLWFNKFEWLDNTLLITYYRLLGKRLVYTAHNINTAERDGGGAPLTRLSLRYLYRMVDHVFVHTRLMKRQLTTRYGVPEDRVTVLPFGLNDVTPRSAMSSGEARQRLGLGGDDRVLLFFGNIAPYKGLDVLVDALQYVPDCRLIIAGRVKGSVAHWHAIQRVIALQGLSDRIRADVTFIPEDDVELYFKAADALVLPYRRIDQSGVLFLSYSFGLPVIASDAGSLSESVIEGETGFVCRAGDAAHLAQTIDSYFSSALFRSLPERRERIVSHVRARHAWTGIAEEVQAVYARLSGEGVQESGGPVSAAMSPDAARPDR